jgi:dipeptidyl aminopeptidase/acylaminoacyl peptidase
LVDPTGTGDLRAYAVAADGGEPTPLTPAGSRARILKTSTRRPHEVLLLSNARDARHVDAVEVDVRTTQSKIVQQNDAGFASFVADESLRVRLAEKPDPNGGYTLVRVGPGDANAWAEVATFDVTEAGSSRALAFDATGSKVFLLDNRDRADTALSSLDLRSKKTTIIAEAEGADIASVLFDARMGSVAAIATFADKRVWRALSKSVEKDLATIARVAEGDMDIVSRSHDDKVWLVAFRRPDSPTRFFRYDRGIDKRVELLFSSDRLLETTELYPMKPVELTARDALPLKGLLTLPRARSAGTRVPLVLWVHGGPWTRDRWEFSPYHQLFASRGYATLSINYRGSRGLGKAFLNAGNREWGGKMQDDLSDAVAWAVEQGIADADRIAIGGPDYGGYAALMGLALSPGRFACGIDIGGPTDLVALLEEAPPHRATERAELTFRIGDPSTPAGLELLRARSPVMHAERLKKPLLVIGGGSDSRASQVADLVARAEKAGAPVTHGVFPDEGRVLKKPVNRIALAAAMDIFLAQCLGGPYEPLGTDLEGGSLALKVGADRIHRLAEQVGR